MLCLYMHPPRDQKFEILIQKAKDWRAPLISVPDGGPWDWSIIPKILNVCRREKVSIWHGHDYKSNALGLLLGKFWPMRLVTTVHGWGKLGPRTPLYYGIDKFCLPYYAKVIAVSPDLHATCLSCGVPEEQCVLMENAIDTREYVRRLSISEAKRSLGVRPERFLIGAVGRLSEEKNFTGLVEATNQLLRMGFDLALVIAGEGEQRLILQDLIRELGLEDRIQLLGYRSDMLEVYQAIDAFALSSLREGLPNVLLEAMALGVPVVATRIAGVPRLISDGESGVLVEPGDIDSLAQALAQLARDPDLRNRLGRAGREVVETRFDFVLRMRRMADLYDSLLRRN
jgi:glycosyltransferase involved in cell wall biosynthesis